MSLAQQWAEGFGWIVLPFFVWGVVKASKIEGSKVGRTMIGVYLILFSAVVIRHATVMGYLSGRHALTLGPGELLGVVDAADGAHVGGHDHGACDDGAREGAPSDFVDPGEKRPP